jgi:hypothetical protein
VSDGHTEGGAMGLGMGELTCSCGPKTAPSSHTGSATHKTAAKPRHSDGWISECLDGDALQAAAIVSVDAVAVCDIVAT